MESANTQLPKEPTIGPHFSAHSTDKTNNKSTKSQEEWYELASMML